MPLAAAVLGLHDARLGEHPEVAADGRPADGVVRGQVDHPGRAARQPRDQVAAYGVTEGCERVHPLLVTVWLPFVKVDPAEDAQA